MIFAVIPATGNSGAVWTPQYFATLIGSLLVGIVVALVAVQLTERRQLRRYSLLRFFPIERHVQKPELDLSDGTTVLVEEVFWRMPIQNTARYAALDVLAEVVQISDDEIPRTQVVVAPLCWMHNPPSIFVRDIFPQQVAYLDICQWSELNRQAELSNSPVTGIPNSRYLYENTTSVGVVMYQRSGQRIEIRIAVDSWDGSGRPRIRIRTLAGVRRGFFGRTRSNFEVRDEAPFETISI